MSGPPSKRMKKEPVPKEKCYVCGLFVINIETHLSSHSPRSKYPYSCRYCRSMFQTEEMQIDHVQNHKDVPCSICSKVIEIERIDRHIENHKRENEEFKKVYEQKKTDNGAQKIPKPTKTPKRPNSPIQNSDLLFCWICQFESSDEQELQYHVDSEHQEEENPKSSKPKTKKKPPNKKQVEEHNRLLIERNMQLTTQLDDERKDKELYIGQLNNLNTEHCDLNERHLKLTEEFTQVRKELAEMKRAKERMSANYSVLVHSSVEPNSNKKLENNHKEMCKDVPVKVQEAIQKEHISIDIIETVHESKEEKSPINSDSQASTSMPEPTLSTLESGNQENLPPVHEKIQNTTPVGNICTTCGKKYTTLKLLKRHMKDHTASDQFSCPHCDKKFSRSDRLKDHSVVHTGKKPYTCLMCPRKFSGSKAWNRHMKNQSCGK